MIPLRVATLTNTDMAIPPLCVCECYIILSMIVAFALTTATQDYMINMNDLTVTIPAGDPTEMCIEVVIVNDDTALEGPETFEFVFTGLPPNVGPGPMNPTAEVTIVDDEGGKYFMLHAGVTEHNFSIIIGYLLSILRLGLAQYTSILEIRTCSV